MYIYINLRIIISGLVYACMDIGNTHNIVASFIYVIYLLREFRYGVTRACTTNEWAV